MSKNPKKKNRIFSFVYIGIFVVSLAVFSLALYLLINPLVKNSQLNKQLDELVAEREWQKDEDNINSDEYYIVYVKDNYSITDNSNTIYVFKK